MELRKTIANTDFFKQTLDCGAQISELTGIVWGFDMDLCNRKYNLFKFWDYSFVEKYNDPSNKNHIWQVE